VPSDKRTSLRTKTLVIIVAATLALVVAICLPLRWVVLARFEELEATLAQKDLERARNQIDDQVSAIGAMSRDYAVWDETYTYAVGQGPENYSAVNFEDAQLEQNRVGIAELEDPTGKRVMSIGFDFHTGKRFDPPRLAELPDTPLPKPVAGLLKIEGITYIVGAHTVLTSAAQGPPHGTLLLGRPLDDAEAARIASQLRLSLSLVALDAAPVGTAGTLVRAIDDDTLESFTHLRDLRGQPIAMLRIEAPRTIYAQGRADARSLVISVTIACLVFGAFVLLLLQRVIVRRVAKLGTEVTVVGHAADHSMRVGVTGHDEIATLAGDVNGMLDALDRLNKELEVERAKAERLLRNILPGPIADRLKDHHGTIADTFPDVTVLFGDLVGFTDLAGATSATDLVVMLNDVFSRFDALAEQHGLEKIKTIGDAYMIVAGVPEPRRDHAEAMAEMGLDMLDALAAFNAKNGTNLRLRIGINSGSVVAGVIGTKKFIYDLWGDAVNIASRMESSGVPDRVHVSEHTFKYLEGSYELESRGAINVKGKGEMRTWLIAPRRRPRA